MTKAPDLMVDIQVKAASNNYQRLKLNQVPQMQQENSKLHTLFKLSSSIG